MRTAGIIGGLGPITTSKFYLEVVFSAFKVNKVSRPPILIWSVPISYKTEEEFITEFKGKEKYIPYLVDAAKRLENGGADFIAIPCNSVHLFIKEIRSSVGIPVLSIVEETLNYLKKRNINEVGLIATSATLREDLYESGLTTSGVKVKKPDDKDQDEVGYIINNLVNNKKNVKDKERLLSIINKFADKKTDTLLLACTDLQMSIKNVKNMKIFDTMDILAQATVREILK